MKTTDLKAYLKSINYNWKKDQKLVHAICKITKTRVKPENERFEAGWEQQYLIKAIAEHINAKNFFEIGTGRGTTSYVMGLLEHVKEIVTLDVVPFDQEQETALLWEAVTMSNKQFHDVLNIPGKSKIKFIHSDSNKFDEEPYKEHFDLIFIDGNHDDANIIMEDFYLAEYVLAEKGLILFDDYNCSWGKGVTEVVDNVISEGNWDCEMVEFRGHLFDGATEPEKDQGLVTLRRKY